ncbi:hypothetical protein MM0351_13320 [Helicobacter pylori]
MTQIYFKGLNGPKQRAAAARLAKDIATNGIEDVERRSRNYSKLEAEKKILGDRVGRLEGEVSRLSHDFERMCDLLLEEKQEKMDTQKFIYCKGDDNSMGKLVGIGSKREGYTSTLYPYVVE